MTETFRVGDHVGWNSEAGHVSGTISKVHTRDFDYKGYTHHASEDEPQYEIRSDKSEHVAAHKGTVLHKIDLAIACRTGAMGARLWEQTVFVPGGGSGNANATGRQCS